MKVVILILPEGDMSKFRVCRLETELNDEILLLEKVWEKIIV